MQTYKEQCERAIPVRVWDAIHAIEQARGELSIRFCVIVKKENIGLDVEILISIPADYTGYIMDVLDLSEFTVTDKQIETILFPQCERRMVIKARHRPKLDLLQSKQDERV